MEKNSSEINLQAVVERFRQAEQNLNQSADQIKKLILSTEIAKESSDSIKEASLKFNQFGQSITDSINVISESLAELKKSLGMATKFMEKTDLTEISKSMSELESKLATKLELNEIIEKLKNIEKSTKSNSQNIKNLFNSLPGRWKNRANENEDY
jgi:predicted DNA-binding protein YlxM (UPF0122 family)